MQRSRVGGLFGAVAAFAVGALPYQPPEEMRVLFSPAGDLSVLGTAADEQVRLSRAGGVYQLKSSRGSTLRAGRGCQNTAPNAVACPIAGVTRITFVTGDGLDLVEVRSAEPVVVPLTISTGPGHDGVYLGPDVVAPVRVDAGAGDDFAQGGVGADHLDGGDGDDVIDGGDGADTLRGGGGDDHLRDNDFDPRFRDPARSSDTLDCGPGVDMPRADVGLDVMLACEQPPSEWSLLSPSSRIQYRYRRFRDGTTLTKLRAVTQDVDRSVVRVQCLGRACPARTWRARVAGRSSFNAIGPLAGHRLRPGARGSP